MFRRLLRGPSAKLGLLLGVIFVLSCAPKVAVTVMGPPELAGAIISVDGARVAEFSPRPRGKGAISSDVFAQLGISRGQHRLEIRRPGFPLIIKDLDYSASVHEDYIWIELPRGSSVK